MTLCFNRSLIWETVSDVSAKLTMTTVTHPHATRASWHADIINVRHIFHCQRNNCGTARLRQALRDTFHHFLTERPHKRPLKAERRAAFKVRCRINVKGVKQVRDWIGHVEGALCCASESLNLARLQKLFSFVWLLLIVMQMLKD